MLVHNLGFAGHYVRPIHLQSADFKAKLSAIFEMVVNIGMVQQSFRGDTANMQAGATKKRIFLYHHSLEPKFASANRGHISTRSATDNRYVVLCHAPSPSTLVVCRASQHLQPDFGGLRSPISTIFRSRSHCYGESFFARARAKAFRDGITGQRGIPVHGAARHDPTNQKF